MSYLLRAHFILCLALLAACESGSDGGADAMPPDAAAADALSPSAVSFGDVYLLASASYEGQAVLAYNATSTFEGHGELMWLDGTGKARGQPQALAGRPTTLATDGQNAIGCWDDLGAVTCQCHARSDQGPYRTFDIAGSRPSIAFGNDTYLLVYVGRDKDVRLQRLGATCEPIGPSVALAGAFMERGEFHAPVIAKTSGWVVAAGNPVQVHRLGVDLQPTQPPVDMMVPPWSYGSLALQEDDVVVYLAKPYGGHMFRIRAQQVIDGPDITAGYKEGADVLLAPQRRGTVAVWNSNGSFQPTPMGIVASLMFGSVDAAAPKPLGVEADSWSRSGLVNVCDQLWLAARAEGELKLFFLADAARD